MSFVMATAHLLFGYIASGKTSLAVRLEREHHALRLTPDDWMARLFGEDPPEAIFAEKAQAIFDLMEQVWTRCLTRGMDVVLDYGFWLREERDHVRARVVELGCDYRLYSLSTGDAEARRRLAVRNRSTVRSLFITETTYEALKYQVEPLGADEPHIVMTPLVAPARDGSHP